LTNFLNASVPLLRHVAPLLYRPSLPPKQVCNHPELFEGQAERWPLQFADSSTAVEDALQPAAPVVLAGPGRPPKAPASSTWVQVTGFRSHIQVGGQATLVFPDSDFEFQTH
jgi:hypothetical protein